MKEQTDFEEKNLIPYPCTTTLPLHLLHKKNILNIVGSRIKIVETVGRSPEPIYKTL